MNLELKNCSIFIHSESNKKTNKIPGLWLAASTILTTSVKELRCRKDCGYLSLSLCSFKPNGIPICPSLESSLWGNLACKRQCKSERQSESELEVGRLPGSQPCDHPSKQPDRQHALLLFTLQVKEVTAPLPCWCALSRESSWRETVIKWEHLEDCAADWATDTTVLWQVPVVCLRVCPSSGPKIFC